MASETIHSNTQSKRKMFVEAEMLHIDESVFYPWDKHHVEANKERLQDLAKKLNLKLHVISLGEKYKLDYEAAQELLDANSDRGSSREDFIVFLRNSAIEDFCLKNNFNRLVVGDSGLRVASNTLTNMIKGKGVWFESGAREVSLMFPGNEDIKVCRPIKEFAPKEIYYYMYSNNLTQFVIQRTPLSVHAPKKAAGLPGRGNFTKVLDDFLNMLQVDFS